MSKKDRERVQETGKVMRDGKLVEPGGPAQPKQQRMKCMVQPCHGTYIPEQGKPPLCPTCLEFLGRLAWFLPRMKFEKNVTQHGIVLPGHGDFKATLQNKEVVNSDDPVWKARTTMKEGKP